MDCPAAPLRRQDLGIRGYRCFKKFGCLCAVTSCSTRKAPSAPGWSQEEPRAWQGDLSLCFWPPNFKSAICTYRFLNTNSCFKACPAAGRMCSAPRAPRLHAAQCQFFSFSRVGIVFGEKIPAFSHMHIYIYIYVHTVSGVDKFPVPS